MNYFSLQKYVNNDITYTQEELYGVFHQAQHHVREMVHHISQYSDDIARCVVSIGSEFITKTDRNRSVTRRSITFEDDKVADVKPDSTSDKARYCEMSLDIQKALCEDDRPTLHQKLSDLFASRMIWVGYIGEWLERADGYIQDTWELTQLLLQPKLKKNRYEELRQELLQQEAALGLTPGQPHNFGIIRLVSVRFRALGRIYDNIFRAYSRAVFKMARDQSVSNDHVLDSFQNGAFGLMRAISAYDPNPNSLFAGQSKWWIRQSMLSRMKEESTLIKLSANVWQHYAKLERMRSAHSSKTPHDIDNEELSEISGYSEDYIERIYSTVRVGQVKSLDCPISMDASGVVTLQSILPDEDEENPEPTDISWINLSPEERIVVFNKFGLFHKLVESWDLNPEEVRAEAERQLLHI